VIVGGAEQPAFALELEVEHAVELHHEHVSLGFAVAAPVGSKHEISASYATVVLRFQLIDLRGHDPVVIGTERVTGADHRFDDAAHQALSLIVSRIASLLAPHQLDASTEPTFVLERVSPGRAFVERVVIDIARATIVRRDVIALTDPGYARPGRWLVSRQTADGTWLSDAGYAALAARLSTLFPVGPATMLAV